jgi:hypothetical protein
MKPHSIYLEMLIAVIQESVESNNPHEATEHTRDSTKLNTFCALSRHKVFVPPPPLNKP